jgi:hypothetical protein
MQKVLCVFLAVAVAQVFGQAKKDETKVVVEDLSNALKQLNVTLTPTEQVAFQKKLNEIKDFKVTDHPELMAKIKEFKSKQVPVIKEKVCKFADKVDDKLPGMSAKIGLGIEKGFSKLGNEKFPASIVKFKELIKDAATKGNKPQLIVTLNGLGDKIEVCMKKHLTTLAAPLGRIIANAGQKNQNAFSKLVQPFIDDCEQYRKR